MSRSLKLVPENLSELDWARLAAFIDGEGCLQLTKQKGLRRKNGSRSEGFHARLIICNTDARLAVWLRRFVVGSFSVRSGGDNPHWLPRFDWVVSNRQAAIILSKCLPYFVMKRDQAEILIAFQAGRKVGGQKGGRPVEVTASDIGMYRKLKELKTPPRIEVA